MEHLSHDLEPTSDEQREEQKRIDDLFIQSDREVIRILSKHLGGQYE